MKRTHETDEEVLHGKDGHTTAALNIGEFGEDGFLPYVWDGECGGSEAIPSSDHGLCGLNNAVGHEQAVVWVGGKRHGGAHVLHGWWVWVVLVSSTATFFTQG